MKDVQNLNKDSLQDISGGLVFDGYYLASNYWCYFHEYFNNSSEAEKFDRRMTDACNSYIKRCNKSPVERLSKERMACLLEKGCAFYKTPEDYEKLPC